MYSLVLSPAYFDYGIHCAVEVLGPVVPLAVADLLGGVGGRGREGVAVDPRVHVVHHAVGVQETLAGMDL